jgi:hypothetical protein
MEFEIKESKSKNFSHYSLDTIHNNYLSSFHNNDNLLLEKKKEAEVIQNKLNSFNKLSDKQHNIFLKRLNSIKS